MPLDRGGFVRLRFRWLVGDATAARVQASARRRRRPPCRPARAAGRRARRGQVEALNTAIDRVNELEDVKAAAEASRRKAVIRAELDALYQQNKQSSSGSRPLRGGRRRSSARARQAADERYAAALGRGMAEEALQAVVPPGGSATAHRGRRRRNS